ncbi:MAG: carboxyltransferase domain-containing protein [Parasphingorhabdus sp.]|uniref:5-oxoprolinase subunit B family protein n=1 Tax=Parasphingorhabdus sp. TaxID=2709688 RepID=UPI0030039453
MKIPDIHACDDWLSCPLENSTVASAAIRSQSIWQEVVSGLDSIAVQFDPARITPFEAIILFREQLLEPRENGALTATPLVIPVCYDESFGPDQAWLANKMGLSAQALKEWHSGLQFTVTMLGFMPGFAYLQCDEDITDIGRLSKPRQKVEAGSIGIIGAQSCIYSFSSPGGWPIIGRTPYNLFVPDREPPALLSANQTVSFRPISKSEFDTLVRGQAE